MPKKILMAAANYWTSPYHTGSHHYAKLFAKHGWEVLYVSAPISLFHVFAHKRSDLKERYKIYRAKTDSGFENINIYVPMAILTYYSLPLLNTFFVAKKWYKMTIPNVVNHIKKLGFGAVDLLWFDSFFQSFWLDWIKYKKSIFRIADKSDFNYMGPNLKKLEKELISRVKHVVYTARSLKPYLVDCKEKMHFLPNGVELDHFLKADRSLPKDLKDIPKPRAIFTGGIHEWFDVDLLSEVSLKCEDISFVLVGKVETDISLLKKRPNIYILGKKDYSIIPNYVHNSDVGFITFDVRHPVVEAVNPIKLYEYMACGLPVVAIRWKELELINSPAYLANNSQEFADLLRKAINDRDKTAFIRFAENNTWEKRFNDLIRIIQ